MWSGEKAFAEKTLRSINENLTFVTPGLPGLGGEMEKTFVAPETRGLRQLTYGYLSRTLYRSVPDKEAVIDDLSGKRITFKELQFQSNRLCNALLDLGLKKGDHVTWISPDRYWVFYIYLITKCGMVNVPVNYRFIAREIQEQVDHSDAKAFIVGEDFVDLINEVRPQLPKVEHYIVITENKKAPEGMLDMWELMANASDEDPEERVGGVTPEDIAFIPYTSGTTGVPKGPMHTHGSALSTGILGFTQPFRYNSETRALFTLPLFHWGGPMVPFTSIVLAGGTVIIPGKVDPARFWELVEKEKVNAILAPTALWVGLTRAYPDWEKVKKERDLSSLKHILNGSAAMPIAIAQEISDAFPGIDLGEGYHSSESIFTFGTKEMMLHPPAGGGRPFYGTEISIRDTSDTTKEVPQGQVGIIFSRGPAGHVGYYKGKENSERCLLPGGWVTSEDTGYWDIETGEMVIYDRVKDVINTGGETVSSLEVEREVVKNPAVLECAVIGTPDPVYQEKVTAVISLRPGQTATADEIMEFCKDKLGSNKRPRRVEIIPSEEFPRTSMGKLIKKELRKRFEN